MCEHGPHPPRSGAGFELAVGILELECDRPRRFRRGAANLGELELNPVRDVDAHPVLLAVAGLTIGRPLASSTPGITTRARRLSMSTSNSIGLNSAG